MALDFRDGGSMGCAFFATADATLSLSEEVPMADASIAERFVLHARPTTVLVSARAPEGLLDLLEKLSGPAGEDGQLPSLVASLRRGYLPDELVA